LSACTQAVLACELGHSELAYAYLRESALIDLDDLQHNTRDGPHIASLAGCWIGAVAGVGGLRDHEGRLSFKPRLPPSLDRVGFRLGFQGRQLMVEVVPTQAIYSLVHGEALELTHHDEPFTLAGDAPVVRAIPPAPQLEVPSQPPGREPDAPQATVESPDREPDTEQAPVRPPGRAPGMPTPRS
jgi:alpha,alpha-trehalose phosphorylase